jgi:hypothetical protein
MGNEPNLEVRRISINRKLLYEDMVDYSKENNFDFPEAPPPSSSPVFNFDIVYLPSSSPPPPKPPPEPTPEPLKRVRKPTAKHHQALKDVLPEGVGPVDTRPEPVPEPPQAVPPVQNIFYDSRALYAPS